ncbi:hypothetical protein GCM10025771_29680 [Niveibacterium umoris]
MRRHAPFLAVLLFVCSGALADGMAPPVIPASAGCEATMRSLSKDARAAAIALRDATEKGPLFVTLARHSALRSCETRSNGAAALTLRYRFANGDRLIVQRDATIEFLDQSAQLKNGMTEPPESVLSAAEIAAFGEGGCGIDWKSPESSASADHPAEVTYIYRGETCNCQARIRRAANGRLIALTLRSAC